MTIFGWDTSSHDDTPASRDGLQFFTCKLTDGDHYYENPSFATKLNAMKGFGVEVLGAYHVLWGNKSIANQVAWFIQMLDARIPWWRDFEYFICQSDDEPFYTGVQTAPSIAQINEFHDRVQTVSNGKLTAPRNLAYAPGWVYGSGIGSLKYPWWQSAYGNNPAGHYPTIYPGDTSSRWNGAKVPFFLQYGSNAIIAGQTTSDANAFRGTLDDLKAALGGGPDMTPQQAEMLYNTAWRLQEINAGHDPIVVPPHVATSAEPWAAPGFSEPNMPKRELDAIQTQLDAIKAALAGDVSVVAGQLTGSISLSGSMSGTVTPTPPATP